VPIDDWTATIQARNRYLAERDAARADADRLAAALRVFGHDPHQHLNGAVCPFCVAVAALTAHDDARTKEGL
jgi:hypothetical protein